LRLARPVTDLARTVGMYKDGLGLREIGGFQGHEGFDGVMLGNAGMSYHFEFTYCRTHPVKPVTTPEDLVVFYFPDESEWREKCESMLRAGFNPVASFNPYWEQRGKTFEDADGYRLVLQQASWSNDGKG
jgi:catechol 2,3-dioxygenase-like lactoylglutathione lyase family enzyme